MEKFNNLHPSGMTWERWRWPFKTEDERKLVIAHNRKSRKAEKDRDLTNLGKAPF